MKDKTKRDLIWFLVILTITAIGIILCFYFVSKGNDGGLLKRLYN
jgi:hypothetical protein